MSLPQQYFSKQRLGKDGGEHVTLHQVPISYLDRHPNILLLPASGPPAKLLPIPPFHPRLLS